MPTFDQGNSLRWRIFDAVATALADAPELQAVAVLRNPIDAVTVPRGGYLLIVRWGNDALQSANAIHEDRRYQLLVGSVANTLQADRDADAMHQIVGGVLRRLMPALNALVGGKEFKISELDVSPTLESLPIEGALVLSSLEVSYRSPAFSLAASF